MRMPGELLVLERGQAPEPLGRVDVEVVDRVGDERDDEPDRGAEDEGGEDDRGSRTVAEAVGLVLDDAPPHRDAGREVERVLEVEQRVRVLERGVVEPRQVPEHVVREPDGERDERVDERTNDRRTSERRRERRREPEHDEERRPLRENDVLEQVDDEQVVHRKRLDRCDRDGEDEHHRGDEAGDPEARGGEPAEGKEIAGGHQRDEQERLRIPRPPVRVHGATLVARGCSSVGRAPAFQAGCRRFEPGRPLLSTRRH